MMKTMNALELTKTIAEKLDLTYTTDNFRDFRAFIGENFLLLSDEAKSLEDYEGHLDATCATRNITLPTAVLRAVWEDADRKFNFGGADFYAADGDAADDLSDVTASEVTVSYTDEKGTATAEFLRYWQQVCRAHDCSARAEFFGVYNRCHLAWNITADGVHSDGSCFEIVDDGDDLMESLYWLTEIFYFDSFADFNGMQVELRYIVPEGAPEKSTVPETCGLLICAQYKYGNRQQHLSTYEEALRLVEAYPIIYTVLPETYKTREMTLCFLDANAAAVDTIHSQTAAEVTEDERLAKCVVHRSGNRFNRLRRNAIPEDDVDLGTWLKDPEVLARAVDRCRFSFAPETYDEACVKAVLQQEPRLMRAAFTFWEHHISGYPKEVERIRNRFELRGRVAEGKKDAAQGRTLSEEQLAFFKCLSLVPEENTAAIAQLFFSACLCGAERPFADDNRPAYVLAMSHLAPDTQNALVADWHFCAKFVMKRLLDPDLMKSIAAVCPIAGNILPDEYILRCGLRPTGSDEDAVKQCEECWICKMRFARFVS